METMSSFLQMGGYAGFVWPAYGLAASIMIALAVTSLIRLRSQQRVLRRIEAEQPDRRRHRHGPLASKAAAAPEAAAPETVS